MIKLKYTMVNGTMYLFFKKVTTDQYIKELSTGVSVASDSQFSFLFVEDVDVYYSGEYDHTAKNICIFLRNILSVEIEELNRD